MLFLNQWKRENGRRNVFMTKSPRKNVPDMRIELGVACMPSELASYRATAPGQRERYNMAKIRTCLRFYACPCYLQVWRRSAQNWRRKRGDIIFPIISQWELSVAMATTVLMESAPKRKSSISPIPLTIHIKIDQDWPTDLGDSIISLLKI